MSDHRYERGVQLMDEIQGEDAGPGIRSYLRSISPAYERFAIAASYGEVYSRPGFNRRDRQLTTIAVIAALGGCEPQLRVHLAAGIEAGLTPDEIIEVCVQIAAYAGHPRASNAIRVVGEVFERLGVQAEGAGA